VGGIDSKFRNPIFKVLLAFILCSSTLTGFIPHEAAANAQNTSYTYLFYDSRPNQPNSNIRVIGDLSVSPFVSWHPAVGALIDAREVGKSRSFEIDVPEAGYYQVEFQGHSEDIIGIWDLAINGVVVGRHDFYSAAGILMPIRKYQTVELTQGVNILTFTSVGKNPAAGDGYNNHSAYPHKLVLTQKEELPSMQIQVQEERSTLITGASWKITPTVQWTDGSMPYDVESLSYTYSSDDPNVASVSADGVVTAVGSEQTQIKVTAQWHQISAKRSFTIHVADIALDSVSLEMDQSNLLLNSSAQLLVNGIMSDSSSADLSFAELEFATDEPEIVQVNDQGVVTGLQVGSATVRVTATLANRTREAELLVVVKEASLARVQLKLDPASIVESQYFRAAIEGYDENNDPLEVNEEDIVYSADGENITYTGDSFFKAIKQGEGEISVQVQTSEGILADNLNISVQALSSDKTRSTYYTNEKVTNARTNVQLYDWAASQRDSAVSRAEQVLTKGINYLWNLVPPSTLPSSYAVNESLGSPISGKSIEVFGSYPYKGDPYLEPWKIIDPSAVDEDGNFYRYPTNDFGAYYASGLDEQGIFQPERADRSLLVNELYPEKGPNWGVDDGFGWVDEDGNTFPFIAYYLHWFLWFDGEITKSLSALSEAYVLSGDSRFAEAGIILLDRIADIYPSLDARQFDPTIYLKSGRYGKAVGSIWETGLALEFASAYDAFFPAMSDPTVMNKVLNFLQEKAEIYKLSFKDSATGIRKNIEDGILRQINKAVRNADIEGNFGFHQSALTMAAVVLDTFPETKDWIDFTFQQGGFDDALNQITGGDMLASLVDRIDRDGHGDEASPHYNSEWLKPYSLLRVADILKGYDHYPEADLYQNVKVKSMFSAMYQLMMAERYTPTIGDTAKTGNPILYFNKEVMSKAFDIYGDPHFAQLLYFLNQNRTDGLRMDIFTADPEQLADQVQAVIDAHGTLQLGSTHLTGFGFAGLRDGIRDVRQLGTRYSFTDLPIVQQSVAHKLFPADATIQLEADDPGHSITFSFEVEYDADYEVLIRPYRAASYGKYEIYVDNSLLGEMDFYGSTMTVETIGTMNLESGRHEISFRNVGKRPEATNYKLGVIELSIKEAQDEEEPPSMDTLRDIWMYYGINKNHGHRDTLNLGIHAFSLDLAPDLGYPEYTGTDPNRLEWVSNTISHNTVVVDQMKQKAQQVGIPLHYDDGGIVKLIDVEAPDVYPQTTDYRRTSAMIRVDAENSYVVDFFKVAGGDDHVFSFHGAEGSTVVEGLDLVAQDSGTYAGTDIEFGQRADSDSVPGWDYSGPGYHWLKNVQRDSNPSETFSVEWQVKDTWNVYGNGASSPTDVRLRLTMLTPLTDAALTAGLPPRNQQGNPKELTYLLAHRQGEDLDSLFTSVIEPYRTDRYVTGITPLTVKRDGIEVEDTEAKAIRVELANGRVDYIAYAAYEDRLYTINDKLQFQGAFGLYSEQEGEGLLQYVHDGQMMVPIGSDHAITASRLEGTVLDFTRELSTTNSILVDMDLEGVDVSELVGRWIYMDSDRVRNAVYEIIGAEVTAEQKVLLDIGSKTLIRSYKDAADFTAGFRYDIEQGAGFYIPLSNEEAALLELNAELSNTELYAGEMASVITAGYQIGDLPLELSDAIMTYSSSDEGVAVVSEEGVVTAIGSGEALITISASLRGNVREASVLVKVKASQAQLGYIMQTPLNPTPYIRSESLSSIAGKQTSTIQIDGNQLKKWLADKGTHAIVPIPTQAKTQMIVVELDDRAAQLLRQQEAVLKLQMDGAAYELPMIALDLERVVAGRAGDSSAKPFMIRIEVDSAADYDENQWSDKSYEGQLSVVAPLVQTSVHYVDAEGILPISLMNGSAKYTWELPKDGSYSRPLTGVYIDAQGGLHPVPTTVVNIDDVDYVQISSRINGTYALIAYSVEFHDSLNHWAKEAIHDLGARMIIRGTGNGGMEPDRQITRGEFAAIVVRALGLYSPGKVHPFVDTGMQAWQEEATAAAYAYGLIKGNEDGRFHPQQHLTREAAAVILSRAMAAVELSKEQESSLTVNEMLDRYPDAEDLSDWAHEGWLTAMRAGLIQGRTNDQLAPRANMTRAETAMIISRLLKQILRNTFVVKD